jgi:hypothetical protein
MSTQTVIYEPPRESLPFLIVTFDGGEMQVVTAVSRTNARKIASEKTIQRKAARRARLSEKTVPIAP